MIDKEAEITERIVETTPTTVSTVSLTSHFKGGENRFLQEINKLHKHIDELTCGRDWS